MFYNTCIKRFFFFFLFSLHNVCILNQCSVADSTWTNSNLVVIFITHTGYEDTNIFSQRQEELWTKKWEKQRINNRSILKWAYWNKNVSSSKINKTGVGKSDNRVESWDWEPSDVPVAAFLSEEWWLQESKVKSPCSMDLKLWQERIVIVCIALKAVQGTINLYKKCAVCSLKEQLVREGWCPSAPFPGAKVPGQLRCGGYTWLVLMSLCLMVCLPGLNAGFQICNHVASIPDGWRKLGLHSGQWRL